MDTVAAALAVGTVLYVALGVLVALAFVTFGVRAVQSAPVSNGARILLVPGAAALWPIVLWRWIKARRPR